MSEFDQFLNDQSDYLGLAPTSLTNQRRIVSWLERSLAPGSYEQRGYLNLDGVAGISFEADLVKLALKFTEGQGFQKRESCYWLLRIWEELVHRHAFNAARCVDPILAGWEAEHCGRSVLRRTAYLYPRIAVALAIGYCSLLGAASTREYLDAIARQDGALAFPCALLAILALGALFAAIEVQRRSGHTPASLFGRAAWMISCGWGYALITAGVHLTLKWWLKRSPCWKYCLLLAAMALTVGFAAHLFWREKSASEPI